MYEIFDAHAHIYPDNIALKAANAIANFYGVEMGQDGTVDCLLKNGRAAGISRYLVHSVATTVHQVHSINRFLESETALHPEFIPFMALHPDMDEGEMAAEIDYCIAHGFHGVKLHPDMQKFAIDGERSKRMMKILDNRLPILFHTGDKRYGFSHPDQLTALANAFPDTRFIGAHFGGYASWDDVIKSYSGVDNVWFDTSSSIAFLGREMASEIIHALGSDRFFFATDYPMWRAENEVKNILLLDLTEQQRKDIFSLNLRKFLNI